MPTQKIYLQWGTWINGLDVGGPSHGGDSYMKVGCHTWSGADAPARPILKFNSDGFSGQIVSVTLNFTTGSEGLFTSFTPYRVVRTSNANAVWVNSGVSDWGLAGAGAASDRSFTPLCDSVGLGASAAHSIPLTNLTEFNSVLSGLYTIIFVENYVGGRYRYILKTPTPYLAVEYTTSLVGGIQIF